MGSAVGAAYFNNEVMLLSLRIRGVRGGEREKERQRERERDRETTFPKQDLFCLGIQQIGFT